MEARELTEPRGREQNESKKEEKKKCDTLHPDKLGKKNTFCFPFPQHCVVARMLSRHEPKTD